MKELVLIRHGEAAHLVGDEATRLTGGWTDSCLTERGHRQAQLTATAVKRLLGMQFFYFYASDLLRAEATAAYIVKEMSIHPTLAIGLRELNNGLAANLTRKEAKKLEIPMTEPTLDWTPYPEAESWGAMHQRVAGFMDTIAHHDDGPTVVVSHGGSIVAMIHWWLGLPSEYYSKISFEIDPCSITRLGMNSFGEKTIVKLNDTAHLPDELGLV